MLDNTLIEKALALTGKEIEDIQEWKFDDNWVEYQEISIEKFCYYLLSPEFIEKYALIAYEWNDDHWKNRVSESVWRAIMQYQLGNVEPLTNLLEKI